MATLKPRNGLVLVQVMDEKEGKTASGIIIPADKNISIKVAKVLDVGPGIWDAGKQCATEDLKPGMLVLAKAAVLAGANQLGGRVMGDLFPSFDTADGKVGLMNQQDILAIIVETPALKITE
jgi:co-chaperonin GroES (HSP10)